MRSNYYDRPNNEENMHPVSFLSRPGNAINQNLIENVFSTLVKLKSHLFCFVFFKSPGLQLTWFRVCRNTVKVKHSVKWVERGAYMFCLNWSYFKSISRLCSSPIQWTVISITYLWKSNDHLSDFTEVHAERAVFNCMSALLGKVNGRPYTFCRVIYSGTASFHVVACSLLSHGPYMPCARPGSCRKHNTSLWYCILPLNAEHLLHFEIQLICFHGIGDDLCRLIGWLTGMPLLPTGDFFSPRPTVTPAEPALLHLCLAEKAFLFCRVCSMDVSLLVELRMNKT